jgi:hypothetical protein
VHVTPDTAKKLKDLAATTGRAPEDMVEDALAGYLEDVASVRKTLDSRHDDLKSGRVKPIDGENAFRRLREKSEDRRSRGRAGTLSIPRCSRTSMRFGNTSRRRTSTPPTGCSATSIPHSPRLRHHQKSDTDVQT